MSENTVDRLEIQVQTEAKKASAELDKLVNKLEKVSSSLSRINASGLQGLANGVNRLSTSMQSMSNVKTADFTRLSKNIEKLGNINQSGINSTASALRTISSALTASTGLTSGATQITELANSISKLGYKSASTAITNIPLMANALRGLMQTLAGSPNVSQNLINMTNAIANLSAQGSKVRSATNSMNGSLKRFNSTTTQATASTKSLSFSLAGLYAKLWLVRRAVGLLSGSIKKSMDFGETINLFQTSFKKIGVDTATDLGMEMGTVASEQFAKGFIDRATSFNKRITEALSLDPNLMMNYQAVFAQMSNSMGLVSSSAQNISESFTLLGNDIASLWNIDTADAMGKLQSGLAGQIRPLRSLGIDISKTSLEMYALKYGIKDSVENMSQAAKVQLRWLAVMEQAEVAFGDMAKTIQSPANQLRILQQQWTNLSRSIGNVFLPMVTAVLPYINGLVIALRRMVDTLATAMGFELPDYTDSNIYTDVTGDIEGIGDGADEASDSVKALKKSLASIDEMTILSEGKNKGVNLDVGSGYGELDDAISDKTASYMKKFNEELEKMSNGSEKIAKNIQEFFGEIGEKISPTLTALRNLWDAIEPFAKNVGKGLLYFLDGIFDIGEDALTTWIPGGLNAIAKVIKLIPEDVAIAIGGAIGGIATSILLFNGATKAVGLISKIGPAASKMLGLIGAHPVLAIGIALAAVAGAMVALNEAKFRNSDVGKLVDKLDGLAEAAKDSNRELKAILEEQDERTRGVEAEYGAVQILADKYFKLADQTKLTNKEQVLLKSYAQELIKKIPELSGLIDEQTGSYKGTKEEIQGLIDKTKEYYLVQAAQESLTELAKGLYEAEKTLATAQTERATAQRTLNGLETEYQEAMDAVSMGGEVYDQWQKTHTKSAADLYKEIKELKKSMGDYDEQITETKGYQKDLNKQFDYASEYIATYSSTANKELPKVETAVMSALGKIENAVKNFKLPRISIDADVMMKYSGVDPYDPADILSDKFKVKQYARGGYPNTGEMFMARENGITEMVGRIGNRTAVANNDQITSGIASAVESAIVNVMVPLMSSMNGQQNNQTVEVPLYLDGEQLARGVYRGMQKYDRRMQTVRVT
jgi:hypothetical protein